MRTLLVGILLVVIGVVMLISDGISDYFADWVVIAGGFLILLGLLLGLLHAMGERRRMPEHRERQH